MNKTIPISIMLLVVPATQCMAMTADHRALQRQFLTIQKDLGIITPEKIVNSLRKPTGKQGTKLDFKQVRSDLNNLLSQKELSADDIELVNQKINTLDSLHPARWPRAEDYKKVLKVKLAKQAAKSRGVPAQPRSGITVQLPLSEDAKKTFFKEVKNRWYRVGELAEILDEFDRKVRRKFTIPDDVEKLYNEAQNQIRALQKTPQQRQPTQLPMISEDAKRIFLSEVQNRWNDSKELVRILDEFDRKVRRKFTIPDEVEALYNQAQNQVKALQAQQQRQPSRPKIGSRGKALSHADIQREFQALQQQFGIETSSRKINESRKVSGRQGTQVQFNRVRSALNRLLSQGTLSNKDIEKINRKINRLKRLNPSRWPRAEDYKEILIKKLK